MHKNDPGQPDGTVTLLKNPYKGKGVSPKTVYNAIT